MDSDTVLDYARFQLSPRRSHCELFVYGDTKTEKIASGLVKPFVTHLKVAEEQVAHTAKSIKLQVEGLKKARTWFNKGTLERFVRFVSTPEVLEMVHTFDSEMSQLEGARGIYSQGVEDRLSASSGESERLLSTSGDITKQELLRAIDVRLAALKQELTMAFARASAAGFTLDTIADLLLFADHFGAHRLNEACQKFSVLCQRRPELSVQQNQQQKQRICEGRPINHSIHGIRSSSDSDMSLDGPDDTLRPSTISNTMVTGNDKKTNCIESSSLQLKLPKSSADTCLVEDGNCSREKERVRDLDASVPSNSTQPTGGSRRLSVQDRINLFESKQKEQVGNTSASVGSVNAVVGIRTGGRPELRRLTSDVSSSVEKSVLRRWSGASDMSIDLSIGNSNCNKKGEESSMTDPSDSSSTSFLTPSSIQTGSKNEEKDTATSCSMASLEEAQPSMLQNKLKSSSNNVDLIEDVLLKDKMEDVEHSMFLEGKDNLVNLKKERIQQSAAIFPQIQCKSSSAVSSDTGLYKQGTSQTSSRMVSNRHKLVDSQSEAKSSAEKESILKGREGTKAVQKGSFLKKPKSSEKAIITEVRDSNINLSELQTSRGNEDTNSNMKHSNSGVQLQNYIPDISLSKGNHLVPEQAVFLPKSEEVKSTSSVSSVPEVSLFDLRNKGAREARSRDSSCQDSNIQRQPSYSNFSRRMQSDRDESPDTPLSPALPASGKKEVLIDPCNSFHSSNEPFQLARSIKGNQELNSHLQMKADELEKLFAEHMLRVPGDVSSTKRGKNVDGYPKYVEKRPEENLSDQSPGASTENARCAMEFDGNKQLEIVNSHEYSVGSKFGDFSLPVDLRGRFYEQYMQKRDLKLREEWRSRRASKEAKMKAMEDRLEQSRAEMKAKFSGSVDRQNSALLIQRRAEKLKFFSACSATKIKGQPLKLSPKEEEGEDLEDSVEKLNCGQDQYLKSTISRKNLSNRSVSSTPRSVSIASNPTMEVTGVVSGRRRTPPENSLAKSVQNFSDLRKENTKPSYGTGKFSKRMQSRSSVRSRGSGESVAKEDNARRSHSIRKGSASPVELSDLSSVNSDNLMVEQADQTLPQKGPESKASFRKDKSIGSVATKTKESVTALNIEDDFAAPETTMSDMVKEELDSTLVSDEVAFRLENNSRLSDSVYSDDQECENGEASGRQDDCSSSNAIISFPLKGSGEAMQESPGQSPSLWNSRIHHSFPYVQETSDIDASVDSPVGSPVLWNSHGLNDQMMDPDAARMRKKWGAAQKPMFINSSLNQPKKDVTKGIKRLLKFGRRNKGSDTLLPDWISASTNSEGDEDLEDVRDLGNHLSDDKPKSRMGFSQHQAAYEYDGFVDNGSFHDEGHSLGTSIPAPPANFKLREDHLSGSSLKAPRSFFSLSSFRSKGSEPKLR